MEITASIIGGVFAIIGTVLGWLLTLIATNYGKIHVNINDVQYSNDGTCTIEFTVIVFNNKRDKSGLNSCKVITLYDNGTTGEFRPIFSDETTVNEFDELLNIDAKTVKKARYRQSGVESSQNPNYYFEYIINGAKKKQKVIIFSNK